MCLVIENSVPCAGRVGKRSLSETDAGHAGLLLQSVGSERIHLGFVRKPVHETRITLLISLEWVRFGTLVLRR